MRSFVSKFSQTWKTGEHSGCLVEDPGLGIGKLDFHPSVVLLTSFVSQDRPLGKLSQAFL